MLSWPRWNWKYSLEELKRFAENRDFNGFTLDKIGACTFKKLPGLTPQQTKDNSKNVDGIWVWIKQGPESLAVDDGSNWIKVPGYDIAGQGDIHHIRGWA